MRFGMLFLLVAAWMGPAFADDMPVPRPRPPEAEYKAPQPIAVDPQEIEKAKAACEDFLKSDIAVAVPADPLAWDNGCLAAAPVSVTAIKLANGKTVELKPAALMRCPLAKEIANWVRNDLAPAADKLGSPLVKIDVAASFACRPRNNVFGAVLSEHGKANALDIRALHLANGQAIVIQNAEGPQTFFTSMRQSACARFMTVLGPGSDKPHETHLHVDLAERRNNYKMCQWILPRPENAPSDHQAGLGEDPKDSGKKAAKNQ